ncbi:MULTISPECIES: hypothetical protein [unclassified Brevibacterium]|uniref:hypothetical protein n=1 Tax=unclassified Brevibacterium TaxID=2614124 RepID=UPI001E2CECC4|nr:MULTISPECIES: hypothetical protein [unclassified Brevibacterium]MCD1285941.1 hypothetical protein [Brevibacterium sp. CCUG 69071]MDK8435007.1 hypothetical protein [Brevibacterium sp. H-BE7]
MFVMTIDQRGSRAGDDAVPELLAALARIDTVRGFQRTIGDEVQGVLDDPGQVAEAVRLIAVLTGWHIGIGIGAVEEPLPDSTAEARGEAFYAARRAVEAAKSAPAHLVVASGDEGSAGAEGMGEESGGHLGFAEAALRLLARTLDDLREQSRGYVAYRLDHPEATQVDIAKHFAVSQQAVSRVLSQGSAEIVAGARALSAHHLGLAARVSGAGHNNG